MMIRCFDILFSIIGLLLLSPIFLVLMIIGFFDTGSPLFRQERVGMNKTPFYLIKFRSMSVNTPHTATHLASPTSITYFGRFLRKSKLDELPQLWNVLVGDMSLVGPRPNLFSQNELMSMRDVNGVYSVRPGITGLAQIKSIDMSNPEILAVIDAKMIKDLNIYNYFQYIILTVFGKGSGDKVNEKSKKK